MGVEGGMTSVELADAEVRVTDDVQENWAIFLLTKKIPPCVRVA
jgi:hypothetical protein